MHIKKYNCQKAFHHHSPVPYLITSHWYSREVCCDPPLPCQHWVVHVCRVGTEATLTAQGSLGLMDLYYRGCWLIYMYYRGWHGKMIYQWLLVQDCSNSIALAMELVQSCTKPSIYTPSSFILAYNITLIIGRFVIKVIIDSVRIHTESLLLQGILFLKFYNIFDNPCWTSFIFLSWRIHKG